MIRSATATLELRSAGPAQLILAIAAVGADPQTEIFSATQDDRTLTPRIVKIEQGGRLHVVDVDAGMTTIRYAATVTAGAEPPAVTADEEFVYLRPSRYCESDTLAPIARAEFSGLVGADLLAAVSSWVGVHLAYVPGSSLPTDGAISTLLNRRGVCRDYAHLVVAFLRALDVPARVVSVYAPGLSPMDFHAVAEASIDGRWRVVDATTLAPRSTLMRIATGRDASDTAFLTVRGAAVSVSAMQVTAVADVLPDDDVTTLVGLG